jgi:hypothetical protein
MAIKMTVPMWTLPSENEQSVGARAATNTQTTQSREYPELGAFAKAIFVLDVSAVSGTTPTLDVTIQGFNEASGKWHTVVTFPQQTATSAASPLAASSALVQAANLDFTRYRSQWVVGGTATPTFTFTLVAIVHSEEPAP